MSRLVCPDAGVLATDADTATPAPTPALADTVLQARLTAAMNLATVAAITAAAIGFAMLNGLQYGRSNHWQYLLHGLHAADPAFLQGDWFTTQTPAHHRAFTWLVQWAAGLGHPEVVLGLMNGAMSVGLALSLYFLTARFTRRPLFPFAALVVLVAHMGINGPGHTNILLPYFVPSVFSGVAMPISLTLLLYRRYAAAGLVGGVGCALHANYLVLTGPLYMFVLLLDRDSRSFRRMAWLVVPWCLAWLPHIPILRQIAAQQDVVDQARRVFWDVYAPLHYRPWTWPWHQFGDFLAVLLAGVAAARLIRLKLDRMAWALLAGLGAIVGLGLLAAMFTRIDLITAVFPWRLAPYLTVAAFMALAISLTPPKTVSPVRRLAAAGLMIAVVFATRMDTRAALWLGAIIGVALASGAVERRIGLSFASALRDGPAIVVLLLLGALMFRAGLWRKDMFGAPYKPAAESLFAWCRVSTPPGTVFVIPPDMPAFRLETGRAVVVDWKCMPLTPADQVEWWRRNVRLAGREVRDDGDMVSAFASLDAQRAASLAGEYGARYLIVDRRVHAGDCSTLPRVFRNAWFDVHELPLPDPSRERKGVVNAHADPPTT